SVISPRATACVRRGTTGCPCDGRNCPELPTATATKSPGSAGCQPASLGSCRDYSRMSQWLTHGMLPAGCRQPQASSLRSPDYSSEALQQFAQRAHIRHRCLTGKIFANVDRRFAVDWCHCTDRLVLLRQKTLALGSISKKNDGMRQKMLPYFSKQFLDTFLSPVPGDDNLSRRGFKKIKRDQHLWQRAWKMS